ncbi:DUF3298 and DUF4163 domain-containing protein [Ureibacillus manganicus]|uniref:DUF3298 and DUF4163 domain-containing protein n=1 Tax=Ureibacillus manganicus TaxID=1266064 RepID=UPI0009DD362A|nr:DUF3298 and DUF4163 domain-containing protein [Ureibacillus manganicus]
MINEGNWNEVTGMIATNLFKLFLSFSALFSYVDFEQPSNTIEVSELSGTSVSVESKTYKEDFLVYPQVTNMKDQNVQGKINEVFIAHIKSSYEGYLKLKNEMEKFKEEDKEHCKEFPYSCEYSYITSYEVKYNHDGKLSVLIYDATYSGGAHGIEPVTIYNFDTQTGDRYTLKDIISNESKFASLTAYVKKYIKENQDLFFDEEMIGDFAVNDQTQFYFTDSGIDLLFQQYEIAPYAAGHPTISIPSSEL